ncbi:MAG: hypothetical protein RL322_2041 [Pseudomonadota bacterium]|jgi:hypothetical protein
MIDGWFSRMLIAPIRFYRYAISPLFAPRCRFFPSCSDYALQAISAHGSCCGLKLALSRVARCHPWGGSGVDEVPDAPRCGGCGGISAIFQRDKKSS